MATRKRPLERSEAGASVEAGGGGGGDLAHPPPPQQEQEEEQFEGERGEATHQEEDDDEATPLESGFPCSVLGCRAVSSSPREAEAHYQAAHRFACSACCGKRAFPTAAVLDRHIEEHHDPFFQTQVDRGVPMYRCVVEGCPDGPFISANARKLHCLSGKHGFPHDFDFEGLGFAAPASDPHRRRRHQQQKQRSKGKATGARGQGEQAMEGEGEGEETTAGGRKRIDAPCRYHRRPGGCRRGEACFYQHDDAAAGGAESEAMDVVDALSEALDSRLRLLPARGTVTFGHQARGRSKKLGKPAQSKGDDAGMLVEEGGNT